MRRPVRTPHRPGRPRPDHGGLTALRHDLVFAVGVVGDALRNRPFTS
ncbi:MAG: hypothetical protein WAV00_10915 [Nocardioides sp.]